MSGHIFRDTVAGEGAYSLMQEQMRGKLLDTRAGKGHTHECKSRGGGHTLG